MEYMTLIEQSKLVQNPLRRGVLEIFPRSAPVLERLPFLTIAGNAYTYNREETLPGIAFRNVNSSYTADTGIVNPITERLCVYGGLSSVDRVLVKTQGNVNFLRAIHDGMKAKAAALLFQKTFFVGDSLTDTNQFDGLKTRITGAQHLKMNGELTLAMIDRTLDQVRGSKVIFCNLALKRKINSLIRAAGQAIETVSGAFGTQLLAYAGTAIVPIGEDENGDDVLAFDEGASNTSSLYVVHFGIGDGVAGLQSSSLDVIDLGLQSGIYLQTLIEHIAGLAVFHPKSAARLSAIENPEPVVTTTTT